MLQCTVTWKGGTVKIEAISSECAARLVAAEWSLPVGTTLRVGRQSGTAPAKRYRVIGDGIVEQIGRVYA